jgi:hypothetical protein
MATKKTTIAAEIKVDTTSADKSVGDLKKEINGVGKATEGSIAQLKELKKELKNTAAGSEDFKRLSAQIRDVEDGIENAKVGANDFAGALENASGPIGQLGRGLRQLEIFTSSWGAALKATGIGLLVAIVGTLTAAFVKNEGAMKKLEPIFTQFGRILNGILGAMEPFINTLIELATNALPYVSKAFEVAYSALASFLQGVGLVGSAVKKFISGDFAGAWDDAKKSVTEFGTRYEESQKRFIKGTEELTDKEKEELAKRQEQAKIAAEKREAEALKAQEKEQAALLKSYEDYLKRREFARKNSEGIYKDEIRKFDQEDADERDKKRNEQIDKDLKWQNKSIANVIQTGVQILGIDSANADARLKITQSERDMRINAAYDIADAMMYLGSIVGEQTKVGKALGVASALINTFLGATEVIRAKSVLPEPFGTIQKIASVAGIIATGMRAVKSITAVQVPNVKGAGGGGGVSIPSIPSISAPLMPSVSTTTLNQAQVNQIGNMAARAYVVESDISGNQERIIRLNRAARIS